MCRSFGHIAAKRHHFFDSLNCVNPARLVAVCVIKRHDAMVEFGFRCWMFPNCVVHSRIRLYLAEIARDRKYSPFD